MTKVSLAELEAVVAVGRLRSFRAAARELGLSPSALSHAIGAVERRIAVRLFHRTTRSVSLSAAGEQFVSRVSPAVREIASALDQANEHRDVPSGRLRLTSSRVGAKVYVFPLVREMRRRHPDVQIDLVTEDRLVDLVAEGYDAGFRLAEAVPREMVAIPCGPDVSMAVVGAPSYFEGRKKPKAPADLLEHECIRRRTSGGAAYRWEFERRGRATTVDVKGGLLLDDDDVMLDAALAGLGLAYVADVTVAGHLAAGRLLRVLGDFTPSFPGARLFHPSRRLVPAALRALIAIVKESVRRR